MQSLFGGKELFTTVISTGDLLGISAGYETKKFRNDALANVMFNALPEFALSHSEAESMNARNAIARLRAAAAAVYRTKKFSRRGEFGELLLHLVIREFYKTVPAVSKLFYVDSANDTVKGFDAVHIVESADGLELWLGETKFYSNISSAIRDVAKELKTHTTKSFLRNEFLFVSRKIDPLWPHADRLNALLDINTSLDKIFSKMKIPVLLTYNSEVTRIHQEETLQFTEEVRRELEKHHTAFRQKDLPKKIEILLILVPLSDKKSLVRILDQKLRRLQGL